MQADKNVAHNMSARYWERFRDRSNARGAVGNLSSLGGGYHSLLNCNPQ